MSSRYGLLVLILALAGCKATVPNIKTVYVPVYKYVAVPTEYTQHIDIARPEVTELCGPADTVCELREVAKKRASGIEQCNVQLDKIKFIQGTNTNGG